MKKKLKLDIHKATLRHLSETQLLAARGAGGSINLVPRPELHPQGASIPTMRTGNASGAC